MPGIRSEPDGGSYRGTRHSPSSRKRASSAISPSRWPPSSPVGAVPSQAFGREPPADYPQGSSSAPSSTPTADTTAKARPSRNGTGNGASRAPPPDRAAGSTRAPPQRDPPAPEPEPPAAGPVQHRAPDRPSDDRPTAARPDLRPYTREAERARREPVGQRPRSNSAALRQASAPASGVLCAPPRDRELRPQAGHCHRIEQWRDDLPARRRREDRLGPVRPGQPRPRATLGPRRHGSPTRMTPACCTSPLRRPVAALRRTPPQ